MEDKEESRGVICGQKEGQVLAAESLALPQIIKGGKGDFEHNDAIRRAGNYILMM